MYKIFLLLIVTILSYTNSNAGTVTYERANQLYHNQEYTEANELYMQMINEGVVNGSVYYNAGNSFYKLKKLGMAIWCYKKALQFEPGKMLIKENLSLALHKIAQKNSTEKTNQPILWLKKIVYYFSINQWAIACLIFFCVALAIISMRKLRDISPIFIGIKKLSWLLFIVFFIGMIGQLLFEKLWKSAIIITDTVLFTSPKQQGTQKPANIEGAQVRILNYFKGNAMNSSKYKIELANGKQVWVDAASLKSL